MKRRHLGCVLAAAVALAPGWACAREASPFVATLAAGVEGFGQSVGDAIVGGSSVFVTATGHADLPAPLTEAYLVNIEGRSASAVEAQRLREQRLAAAQAAAARFGVSVEVGPTAFSRETDFVAQQRRRNQVAAERLAHPGTPIVEPVIDDADRVFRGPHRRPLPRCRRAHPPGLPRCAHCRGDRLAVRGAGGRNGRGRSSGAQQ